MRRKHQINYLSDREMDSLIDNSFTVLEETGVYVPNEEAKSLFKSHGGKEVEGDRILIPKGLVKQAVEQSLPSFKLYDQTGQNYLQMEIGRTYYGPGSDLLYVIDMETEKPRESTLNDVATHISLIDNLDEFDFLMSTGLPSDVKQENLYRDVFRTMVLNSNKPIIATVASFKDLQKVYDVAVRVAGSEEAFKERPFFLAYLEPISPLQFSGDTAERVMYCAEKGIPLLFAAGSNIATQSPGTAEGSVTQGLAESLSGLVLAWLKNKDAKFVLGSNSADFDDMKGMVSYGGPGWAKTMAFYTEAGRILNKPVWGTGGSSDSNRLDAQAGLECAISLFMAEFSGATLIHDVGYLGHGYLTDSRAYEFNAEIIKRVRWLRERGDVNDEGVLALIHAAATGMQSTFLEDSHTLRNLKTRYKPAAWVDRNEPVDKFKPLTERLKDVVKAKLEENPPVTEGEIQQKYSDVKVNDRRTVHEVQEKKKTLDDLFWDFTDSEDEELIANPQPVLDYLEEKFAGGADIKELYSSLIGALMNSIEKLGGDIPEDPDKEPDINLTKLMNYVRLFDQSSSYLLSKKDFDEEKKPFILGSAEGDLHYIGMGIVNRLVSAFGYEAIAPEGNPTSLVEGVDVKTGEFIRAALDNEANLIGISALITTTMPNMGKTITALKDLGLKDQIGVVVGGAVVKEKNAAELGADGLARATEAANLLDRLYPGFNEVYGRKQAKDFFVIGEALNDAANKKIRRAIAERDKDLIEKVARRQIKKGARYLDVAVTQFIDVEERKDTMKWMVENLNQFDVPLCIDNDDYRVIEAGLKVYGVKKPALINSATLDEGRLENTVRLAAEYGASIVFMAAEGNTVNEKIEMTNRFLEYAEKQGISAGRVFVDPGLQALSTKSDSAMMALQTISGLRDLHPELNYTLGLTNIGFGLLDAGIGKTKALQQTFVKLGQRLGLNSAISDPGLLKLEFDKRLVAESIELIAGLTGLVYEKRIKDLI